EIGATRTILSAVSNIKYNVKMMRWYVDKAVRYKNALKVSPVYAKLIRQTGSTTQIVQADGLYTIWDNKQGYMRMQNIDEFRAAKLELKTLKKTNIIWGAVGIASTTIIAFGSMLYGWINDGYSITDLEFTAALAAVLAQIIVAILEFILSINPIGALIFSVIAVIDSLIIAVCAIVEAANGSQDIDEDVDTWVCGGIMGAVTKAITYLIFDQTPLIDLEKEGRIQIGVNQIVLEDPVDGLIQGNSVNLSMVVTSSLYANSPNSIGYVYAWGPENQFADEHLAETGLAYDLQDSKGDVSVSRNSVNWDVPDGRKAAPDAGIPEGERYFKVFYPSENIPLSNAGLNQKYDLYLSEGFNMLTQECWVAYIPYPVPVCYHRGYDDTLHTDLSEDFIFDVFPSDFSGFIKLAATNSAGTNYRLDWDSRFPTLWDADGDGLISIAKGGDDINDGNSDSDSDGLSDRYEFEIGSKQDSPDSDCDGLTDYWEVFYETDPNVPDSDRDGLTDGLEVFHSNLIYPYENTARRNNTTINACENNAGEAWSGGWEVVYDFDENGDPLTTIASADPTDVDSDDDGIIDNFEFIYGYNPNAVSSLNVLSLESGLVGGEFYQPGETVVFTATIKNELDNRYASGLLQSEYPTDDVQSTEIIDTLLPLQDVEMGGSITLESNVSASQTTSMTIRAGAVIEDLDQGRELWLRFNEAAFDTNTLSDDVLFADDSLLGHDATCFSFCPEANGFYGSFDGDRALSVDHMDEVNLSGTFSFGFWLRPTGSNPDSSFLFDQSSNLRVVLNDGNNSLTLITFSDPLNDGRSNSTAADTLTQDTWQHVMFTVKPNTNSDDSTVKVYINGLPEYTWTKTFATTDNTLRIGNGIIADLDEVEVYDFALNDTQVQNLVNAPMLQVDFGSRSDESIGKNTIICANCPSASGATGSFSQEELMTASGKNLDLSNGQFSFATWIKPIARSNTFDTRARNAFSTGRTGSYDWQAVFGNESYVGGKVDGA
ncbi:MAG: LamG-like jellyroll fold domain-containing protein, partial [Chloroflexota bacterium]